MLADRIVVFGAGTAGQRVVRTIGRCRVRVVVDNDAAKWGGRIQGIPVVDPGEIVHCSDRIVIATVFAADVYGQLLDLGVDAGRIEIASSEAMNGALIPSVKCLAIFAGLSLLALTLLIAGMT